MQCEYLEQCVGIVCAPTYSYCNATKCALSIVFSIYRNAINDVELSEEELCYKG